MISCYIIGDVTTVDTLITYIEKHTITQLQGYSLLDFDNLEGLLIDIPKILFIDISLITKFKVALAKIGKLCNIVYVSDTRMYAYEAFETSALDYLLKPLTFNLFEESINKFISFSLQAPERIPRALNVSTITDSFFIKSDARGQKDVLIKCDDVIYIEALQNEVIVHTIYKDYVCYNTLKDMEENLPDRSFIRVHKSFIINYDRVSSIERNVITLNGNEKLTVQIGNTYRKAFLERKVKRNIKKKSFTNVISFSKYSIFLILLTRLLIYDYGFL